MSEPSRVKDGFSVLVNSSDSFEDCWQPFFTLFSRYWPDCDAPLFLNTESKSWAFDGLAICATQVAAGNGGRRLTWSECLLAALDKIETPIVLYLQEDYFIEQAVNGPLIKEMVAFMTVDRTVKHIGLTHFGSSGPFSATNDPRLWQISPTSKYLISTQAGLWRVDALKSYIRAWENGWMFEIFGTIRARRRRERFLTLNRDSYNPARSPVVQYLHTGIVKGQWHPGIQNVFAERGIEVDFGKRGFHRPKPAVIRRLQLLSKIASQPINALRSLMS